MQTDSRPASWQPPPGWARVGVPAAARGTVLEFLLQRFTHVPLALWEQRLAAQAVRDGQGRVLQAQTEIAEVQHVLYPRHPVQEPHIPFEAQVLYRDAHVLVADKPHFLPVAPGGNFVAQTLLARLQQQCDVPHLAPLHRLDKDTAGVVMFSTNPATRDAYHALFRTHALRKTYEAVARADERWRVTAAHCSRLEPGGARFFTMQEVPGVPNSETHITLMETLMPAQGQGQMSVDASTEWGLYRLQPVTGKKHQLRVHMAALGMPIRHDPFYPQVVDPPEGDFSQPLQLLARSLEFVDPVSGQARRFESQRALQWPVG